MAVSGLMGGATTRGQGIGGETSTTSPQLPDGRDFNAPVSLNGDAVKNWDSPPGSWIGCCVIASNVASARYLGLPEVADEMKRLSFTDRGGHNPDKLNRQWQPLLKKFPDFQYTQFWDGDEKRLYEWSAAGRPLAVTMAWGKNYSNGTEIIAHMVNAPHVDPEWTVILDNNFVESYSVMPTAEFLKRWKANQGGWFVVITSGKPRKPPSPLGAVGDEMLVMWIASGFLFASAAIKLRRRFQQ